MPVYVYFCSHNGETVEVVHSMQEDVSTWGDLCGRIGKEPGETPPGAPVERILQPASLSMPAGDAKLRELGFTKLVRRDKGVYENVTAGHGDNKVMTADDPSSTPTLANIRD